MTLAPIVRAPAPRDLDALARLCAELGYPADAAGIAPRLEALSGDPRYAVGVAEVDGGVVGWIVAERRVTLEYGTTHEITGLVVDAGARRTGAGRALVDFAMRWAEADGAHALVVRSNVLRDASHPFYESLGFVRRKTQHVYARPIAR